MSADTRRPPPATAVSLAEVRTLFAQADKGLEPLRIDLGGPAEPPLRSVEQVRRRRTRAHPQDGDSAGVLTLVRDERGVFDWQIDGGPASSPEALALPRRRAAGPSGRAGLFDVEPIDQAAFTPVQGSQVTQWLDGLDARFNPRYGLFALDGSADAAGGRRVDAVAASGRVLLIIHGTFSRSEAIVQPFAAVLQAARAAGYDQVLVFEHPTLAVSPMLNALDLARAFAGSRAQVDVIAHSRGGLVARWWLEVLDRERGATARVVFFGSPLSGTALASPFKLRAALRLLTNVAIAAQGSAQLAAAALPLFTVVQGLMTLVASAASAASRAPLADAAVAMVPGLAAMSLYGVSGTAAAGSAAASFIQGNHELRKLGWGLPAAPEGYHAVRSNFEPTEAGWAFWRVFRQARERAGHALADVLFDGANDLVVDTASMTRLAPDVHLSDPARLLDFGTSATVHHLNYFQQPESAAFVRRVLGF